MQRTQGTPRQRGPGAEGLSGYGDLRGVGPVPTASLTLLLPCAARGPLLTVKLLCFPALNHTSFLPRSRKGGKSLFTMSVPFDVSSSQVGGRECGQGTRPSGEMKQLSRVPGDQYPAEWGRQKWVWSLQGSGQKPGVWSGHSGGWGSSRSCKGLLVTFQSKGIP